MDLPSLEALLSRVSSGECSPHEAVERLLGVPSEDLGFATVDHARTARCGYPEVVYGEGKTPEQAVAIVDAILRRAPRVLVTRAPVEMLQALGSAHPEGSADPTSRTFHLDREPRDPEGRVMVVSAGTSDRPVAEEARITAQALGSHVEVVHDVGVAGLHRVVKHRDRLATAHAIVVVAGMEGALPSVVAGLVDRPVIAVPTSVGYGAALGGLAALLGMLTSCASGVTVVNIDNGFGAGYAAARINRLVVGAPS
jgi:hypothetical protein